MEDNKYGYDPSDNEDYDDGYQDDIQDSDAGDQKTIRGYRIVISILAVILVALSALYFNIHRQQQADYDLLSEARDSVVVDLNSLIIDFDSLKTNNDSISSSLIIERHRADSIITQLKRERSFNYAKLKQYEKEVGTLRTIMKGYLRQIDSLNSLNKQLITENVGYRKTISTVKLRAEIAEERADELNNRVRQGAIIKARDIAIETLNDNGRKVSRVKRAERLRVDFVLTANELSEAGDKTIYLCLISPDGFVLSTNDLPTFDLDGQAVNYTASRRVDYQNQDLGVSIFYDSQGFIDGTYKVELYCEGVMIGLAEIPVK